MSGFELLIPIFSAVGTAVTVVGTIAAGQQQAEQARQQGRIAQQQAEAARQQGLAAQAAAQLEAKQYDLRAKDEFAVGQREAEQFRRQRDLALSSLQARAGSGGFSATDPSSLATADEIARYGTLQEQLASYGGAARARGELAAAAGRRTEGANRLWEGNTVGGIRDTQANSYFSNASAYSNAGYLSAAGTAFGGAASFGERYWRPRATSTSRYKSTSSNDYYGGISGLY